MMSPEEILKAVLGFVTDRTDWALSCYWGCRDSYHESIFQEWSSLQDHTKACYDTIRYRSDYPWDDPDTMLDFYKEGIYQRIKNIQEEFEGHDALCHTARLDPYYVVLGFAATLKKGNSW